MKTLLETGFLHLPPQPECARQRLWLRPTLWQHPRSLKVHNLTAEPKSIPFEVLAKTMSCASFSSSIVTNANLIVLEGVFGARKAQLKALFLEVLAIFGLLRAVPRRLSGDPNVYDFAKLIEVLLANGKIWKNGGVNTVKRLLAAFPCHSLWHHWCFHESTRPRVHSVQPG